MHTFSPSKMWIGGLSTLSKPFLHLHTQFNRDLPWAEIDMDFMNLNQAAHGDREAGFIHTRLRLNRKIALGHWSDEEVQALGRHGCGPSAAGMIGRGRNLPASTITCARWQSPKGTKCRPKPNSAIRSTATASATWWNTSTPLATKP